MRGIPLTIPLAWTRSWLFVLQAVRFCDEIRSDCLRHREFIR
jgi:hypothetical protein